MAPAAFDPLAEPRRFYSEFKGRVASLRLGVQANPAESQSQVAMQPRAADAVIAAATAPPPVARGTSRKIKWVRHPRRAARRTPRTRRARTAGAARGA